MSKPTILRWSSTIVGEETVATWATDHRLVAKNAVLMSGTLIESSCKQEIEFSTVGDLIKWIGFISCEPVYPGIEDPYYVPYGQGIHLVLWNTVTLRIISGCTSCSLQSVLDAAKIILTQVQHLKSSNSSLRVHSLKMLKIVRGK